MKLLKINTVNDTLQYPIRALAYISSQTLYTILLHNDIFSYLAKNYGFHESSRITTYISLFIFQNYKDKANG